MTNAVTALVPLADWLATHSQDQEGHCGNPDCTDHRDHAPDTAVKFKPGFDPIARLLVIPKGGN